MYSDIHYAILLQILYTKIKKAVIGMTAFQAINYQKSTNTVVRCFFGNGHIMHMGFLHTGSGNFYKLRILT